jgi:hypothetical protein
VLAVLWALQNLIEDRARLRPVGDPLPITEVKLADLFDGSGFVAVNDALDIPAGILRHVCSGEAPDPGPITNRPLSHPAAARIDAAAEVELTDDIRDVLQRSGLTEDRLASRLKVDAVHLAHMSFQLWQSTFSEGT